MSEGDEEPMVNGLIDESTDPHRYLELDSVNPWNYYKYFLIQNPDIWFSRAHEIWEEITLPFEQHTIQRWQFVNLPVHLVHLSSAYDLAGDLLTAKRLEEIADIFDRLFSFLGWDPHYKSSQPTESSDQVLSLFKPKP